MNIIYKVSPVKPQLLRFELSRLEKTSRKMSAQQNIIPEDKILRWLEEQQRQEERLAEIDRALEFGATEADNIKSVVSGVMVAGLIVVICNVLALSLVILGSLD